MTSTVLTNHHTSTLPPLAFVTPAPSLDSLQLREIGRTANEPPHLKRKRSSSCASATVLDTSYLPAAVDLPYLDCENICNIHIGTQVGSSTSLTLPNIKLYPRTKRPRIGCFLSSLREQGDQDRSNYHQEKKSSTASTEDKEDDSNMKTSAKPFASLRRTCSSKTMPYRSTSMNLSRSLSLQFNMSLLNLAAVATNNCASDCCPLSASTSSMMPKRKSLLHIPSSFPSSQDVHKQDVKNKEPNHRRSPVTKTLGYLAKAMRFPDVSIGLSI